ncbi:tyrosine-type recombinase/integrase [Phytopseudomonas daroniae]|uniref:tyrosine-type recombinase/integrase n=1 Tax=Phytopseudomonas daroniae TaxID=2487519 RepID=UPI0010385B99|nr:integrase arm-type DNA-binding domain-containing protein [Pseudomonas daroniae]TBU78880.1 integrase [Pseudomonas daroniae]
MARPTTPLTDPKCEAAKPRDKDYSLFDGQGLFLLVKTTGTRVWRFKFTRPTGKQGLMTFGQYPALSLKLARHKRSEAKELLAQGIDPIEHGKRAQAQTNNITSFEKVTRAWHAAQLKRGKWSPAHAERILREMEVDLFPTLGNLPVESLKTRDLLVPLHVVEARNALDMAARLKQRTCAVMRHAVQTGLIDYNPAQNLTGAISTRKTKHRPALPLERLGELLERLQGYSGRPLTRLAMLLSLHVFIRSSELRFARWKEIDPDRALWIIPAQRVALPGVKHSTRGSKMGDEHLVPLSPQALAILRDIQAMTGDGELVCPSDSVASKPMSENTINAALRRMGYDTQKDICGHGFRTMACSALVESNLWSRDAVERQMSHKERNGVRAAYIHRAEHLEEGRLMLNWWSSYLVANQQKAVTPFDYARPKGANIARTKQA